MRARLIPARNEAGLDEIAEVVVARLMPRLGDVRVVLDIDDDVPSVAVDEMQLDQVGRTCSRTPHDTHPPATMSIWSLRRTTP